MTARKTSSTANPATPAAPVLKYTLDEGAYPPERAHATDAGVDIRAREGGVVPQHGSCVFHTGVHVQLPHGYAGLLVSRSGLNFRNGLTSTGLVDECYTGEILVKLYNHSDSYFVVHEGDKITQLLLVPTVYGRLQVVESLDATDRGDGGFGSTGR